MTTADVADTRELRGAADLEACAGLLRSAFGTVASEFGLTPENAPTNAAFTTTENLRRHVEDGMVLYGMFLDGRLAGCVAIKKSKQAEGVFYVERLAVDPGRRHRGYGARLVAFAMERVRSLGGSAVSVGLIDANQELKAWYRGMGFAEHDTRRVAHLPFKVCFMSRSLGTGPRAGTRLPPGDGG